MTENEISVTESRELVPQENVRGTKYIKARISALTEERTPLVSNQPSFLHCKPGAGLSRLLGVNDTQAAKPIFEFPRLRLALSRCLFYFEDGLIWGRPCAAILPELKA
jgi:hypothetical protein